MTNVIAKMLLLGALGASVAIGPLKVTSTLAADNTDTPLSAYAAAKDPPVFDSAEQAIEAFKTAVASGDFDKLATLLGLDPAKTKTSDGVMDTYADIQAGLKKKLVVEDVEGSKVLEIGDELWPLPFPIAKGTDGKWSFDTFTGLEEIANRLVGQNELETIATIRAYVDAQNAYALEDHDGDGVLEFAQKLISSEGKQDGLYWPTEQGDGEESPAGAALADGAVLAKVKAGQGYFGYRYKILTGQGDNIAGGKYDYIINGNMIAGFALVAWPVNYGVSGVNTFLISRDGVAYQADLGEKTATVAAGIRTFNPDDKWEVVSD